jgi:hypothetical protein
MLLVTFRAASLSFKTGKDILQATSEHDHEMASPVPWLSPGGFPDETVWPQYPGTDAD